MLFDATLNMFGPEKRPKMGSVVVFSILEGMISAWAHGTVMVAVYFLARGEFTRRLLTVLLAALGVLYVLRFVFSALAQYRCQLRGAEFIRDGRMYLGERLRKVPLGFFQTVRQGDLTSRLMSNIQDVEMVITHYYSEIISSAIAAVSILLTIGFFIDWRIALAAFSVVPFFIPTYFGTKAIFKRVGKKRFEVVGKMNDAFIEFLSGIKILKAHGLALERLESLKGTIDESKKMNIRIEASVSPVVLGYHMLLDAGLSITLIAAVRIFSGGALSAPDLIIGIMLAYAFFKPMKGLSFAQAELRNSLQSSETIQMVLNEPTQQWREGERIADTAMIDKKVPALRFKNVSFSYGGKANAASKVTLDVAHGSVTALVGASGSGKTTLANIAMRLWDVQDGSIECFGKNIADIEPEELLSHMSVVFQDVYLFNDTIAANIGMGKVGASRSEIEQAAHAAQADAFIRALPDGYDTIIAEGGATLSGGEKQRIAIARCMLKNAPIVILDEATASLDPENEREIQLALSRLLADKTVLVIAHRLKTIQSADTIAVVDNGTIVEKGTHEILLAQGGYYARMWKNQEESAGWTLRK